MKKIMSTPSCLDSRSVNLSSEHFLKERNLIRLMAAYIAVGIFFMLIPGTLLRVWNLLTISKQNDPGAAATLWIQAHGHAQLFGWLGTFILGIGFYSIPNLRKMCSPALIEGWACLLLWSVGVALRWYSAIGGSGWQFLLPLSALLEVSAVGLFVWKSVEGSIRKRSKKGGKPWALLLISGSLVWLILMIVNVQMMFDISMHSNSPMVPLVPGREFLYVAVWGWVIPIVWGLSGRWLPALLGLNAPDKFCLCLAAAANMLAVITFVLHVPALPEAIIFMSSLSVVHGLQLFAPPASSAKINGVHSSFPVFVRAAFVWLLFSATLFLISCFFPSAAGTAGAARHAITVGFFSTMVFSIGPRMLPAFTGRKKIFSEGLMFGSSLILSAGCLLRVCSEILAYDFSIGWCWQVLPISALVELTAMGLFAINLLATLRQKPFLEELTAAKAA